MFGTFRFLLAIFVLLSHTSFYKPFRVEWGVWAVVNFFMLSGYVMAAIVETYYPRLGKPVIHFYIDRFLRIYPQYFFWLLLTALILPFLRPSLTYQTSFISGANDLIPYLLNVLVIPLNYFSFSSNIEHFTLVPNAWSLALEEQFYLIFPFLALAPKSVRYLTALVSFTVASAAAWGFLPTDLYGYRLLPGVIFIFLLGHELYLQKSESKTNFALIILFAASLIEGILLYSFDRFTTQYRFNREVFLGIACGVPLIWILDKLPRKRFDEALGHLSYGVFLNQFLVMWFLSSKTNLTPDSNLFVCVTVVLSVALSGLGYTLTERWISPLRKDLRKRLTASLTEVS